MLIVTDPDAPAASVPIVHLPSGRRDINPGSYRFADRNHTFLVAGI